jgi:hypothetical protein
MYSDTACEPFPPRNPSDGLALGLGTSYLYCALRMRLVAIDGDGHPTDEFEARLPGATAQRWSANRSLGDPGSTAERSLAPVEQVLRDVTEGRPSPHAAWHERGEKGKRSSRLHTGGPKRGPMTRQRSWGRRRTQCEATGRVSREEVARAPCAFRATSLFPPGAGH